jgi:hypothetical protein
MLVSSVVVTVKIFPDVPWGPEHYIDSLQQK